MPIWLVDEGGMQTHRVMHPNPVVIMLAAGWLNLESSCFVARRNLRSETRSIYMSTVDRSKVERRDRVHTTAGKNI